MRPLRFHLAAAGAAIATLPLALAATPANGPFTVTVNSSSDADAADGVCSLREAIIAVNQLATYRDCSGGSGTAGAVIAFAIPGSAGQVHTIEVASRLPAITRPVLIDGLTQGGADCSVWPPALKVVLHSASNGAYNGLTLDVGSDGSQVRGLVINGFNNNQGYAFNFNAAINIYRSGNNRIECNFLGTDASGVSAVANLRGVDINSASGNIIGSGGAPSPYFARNLISGNTYGQVDTRGDAPTHNLIAGNYIGPNAAGMAALGGGAGVSINGNPNPATGNIVGWDGVGDPALMRNLISGSSGGPSAPGLEMVVGAHDNRVAGNYIGTDATGLAAIGNAGATGIGVALGSNASVYGNLIGDDGTQGAAARNVISGNTFAGIDINGANGTHDNAVVGNWIGVKADGSGALPNGSIGLSMDYASARTLVARNWFAGQPTAIRFFGSGSFGGGAVAYFLNGVAPITGAQVLDSRDNCVLGTSGVQVTAQGATVPPNTFANNWWGAAGGPNSAGASNADASVATTPWLTAPAAVCDDTLFRNGFEAPAG